MLLASIPERCGTVLAYGNKPPSRGLRGVDPLVEGRRSLFGPHGGRHCSDLKSLDSIVRVNHRIRGIVRFGGRCGEMGPRHGRLT